MIVNYQPCRQSRMPRHWHLFDGLLESQLSNHRTTRWSRRTSSPTTRAHIDQVQLDKCERHQSLSSTFHSLRSLWRTTRPQNHLILVNFRNEWMTSLTSQKP